MSLIKIFCILGVGVSFWIVFEPQFFTLLIRNISGGFSSKYCTVCPGSSDPPEKILNIFASEHDVYTIF